MTNPQKNAAAQLEELIATGTEADVREFVRTHFDELPEDLRQELMAASLAEAIEELNRQRETVVGIQEKGIAALELLDEWEKAPEEPGEGEVDK